MRLTYFEVAILFLCNCVFAKYHKVAIRSMSCLLALQIIFRLLTKTKFVVYLLWPFGKKLSFAIVALGCPKLAILLQKLFQPIVLFQVYMLSLAFADIDCLFSPNQGITLPIKKEELKYLAVFYSYIQARSFYPYYIQTRSFLQLYWR